MSHQTARVPYLRVMRSPRYFPLWLGPLVFANKGAIGRALVG